MVIVKTCRAFKGQRGPEGVMSMSPQLFTRHNGNLITQAAAAEFMRLCTGSNMTLSSAILNS